MFASVRALLAGIVDYAGMFPPAKLPLDQALRNYLRYRTEPDAWMLGRFICPAARLGELTAFHDEIASLPAPLTISALARGGADAKQFLDGVRADLADLATFHERFLGKAVVDAYEAKLPGELYAAEKSNQLFAVIGTTAFLFEKDGPPALTPFYEPPSARREIVTQTLEQLTADRTAPEAARRQRVRPAGLKLRCGGDPAALPTCAELAFAITQGRDHGIALKFTAGLHHPMRHYDKAAEATMHGFLNLFVAGVFAYANTLKESTVERILEVKDARQFRFDKLTIQWNNLGALPSQVQRARETVVTSFGSCSFDEPREDLRGLRVIS
jgi:hypothetical protein